MKNKKTTITIKFKNDSTAVGFIASAITPDGKTKSKIVSLKDINNLEEVDQKFLAVNQKAQEIKAFCHENWPSQKVIIKTAPTGKAVIANYRPNGISRSAISTDDFETFKNEKAKDLLDIFGHMGRFKAVIKHLIKVQGIDTAITIANGFNAVVKEYEAVEHIRLEEERKQNQKAVDFLLKLESAGLDMNTLNDPKVMAMLKNQKKVQSENKATIKTYQVMVDSQPLRWNGEGVMPEAFKKELATGTHLSELLLF